MPHIDWSDDFDGPSLRAGAYHFEVAKAEYKKSAKGDEMLVLRLVALDHNRVHLCYDRLMLEGGGRFYARPRLIALGLEKGEQPDADYFVGRQGWAHVVEEEYKGKRNMAIANDRGTHGGYSMTRPDVGVVEEEVRPNLGENPFSPSADEKEFLEADDTPF